VDAAILAAGKGTRMGPLTCSVPKVLLKVANKPILGHILERLIDVGIDRIFVIVHQGKEQIEEYLKTFEDVVVVSQDGAHGTADAVRCLEKYVVDRFIVVNGDILFEPEDIKPALEREEKYLIALKKVEKPAEFGIVDVEGNFVRKIVEKPADNVSGFVNAGIYVFSPPIFDYLKMTPKSLRGEYEITTTLQMMIENGEKIGWFELLGKWIDIGRPWDLLDANEMLLREMKTSVEGYVEVGAHLKGQIEIGDGTLIRSGAYIEGPVKIGKDCTIGPNCYIRPSTSIGDRVYIGNGVEIKNSIIGDDTRIGHLSYVGDSVIGKGCNFGAGTKVANLRHDGKNIKVMLKGELVDTGRRKLGVIMGDHVHTGINTSINTGVMISPGSTTLPGEVVMRNR